MKTVEQFGQGLSSLTAVGVRAKVSRDSPPGILVVDDQHSVAALVRAILQRAGYTVIVAYGAAEAIQFFQEHRGEVTLLLTDVVMPGMNGFQLAAHIAALRPGLPVVFMSGAVPARDDPTELTLLRKPFLPDELLGCIRGSLQAPGPSGRD